MKKRIVSFLLALVMAVSLLPVSAFAVDGDNSQNTPSVQSGTEYPFSAKYKKTSTDILSIQETTYRSGQNSPLYLVKCAEGTSELYLFFEATSKQAFTFDNSFNDYYIDALGSWDDPSDLYDESDHSWKIELSNFSGLPSTLKDAEFYNSANTYYWAIVSDEDGNKVAFEVCFEVAPAGTGEDYAISNAGTGTNLGNCTYEDESYPVYKIALDETYDTITFTIADDAEYNNIYLSEADDVGLFGNSSEATVARNDETYGSAKAYYTAVATSFNQSITNQLSDSATHLLFKLWKDGRRGGMKGYLIIDWEGAGTGGDVTSDITVTAKGFSDATTVYKIGTANFVGAETPFTLYYAKVPYGTTEITASHKSDGWFIPETCFGGNVDGSAVSLSKAVNDEELVGTIEGMSGDGLISVTDSSKIAHTNVLSDFVYFSNEEYEGAPLDVLLVQVSTINDTGNTLTDEQKKPLADLLATVADGNTNYYQSDDRWNGKTASKTGFWAEFTAANGPRAKAQKVLETAATEEQITTATAALQAAIADLIPADRANTTLLYEELQNAPSAENYTVKSWATYKTVRDKAEALMATMFDADGNPTDDSNKAAANESIETMAAELETARKALNPKATDGNKAITSLNLEAIRYLAEQYDPDTLTGYTAESMQTLRDARTEALKKADEIDLPDLGQNGDGTSNALRELRKAIYGLTTTAAAQINVKVSVLDANDIYAGYTGEFAHLHNPNTYTASMTLDANASAYDLLNGKSLLKNRNIAAEAVVFLNGELVYGSLGATGSYQDIHSTGGSSTFQSIRLHDKDELTIVWIYPKQVEYSSQTGTYPACLMDIPDYFRYSTVSAPIEVEAGQPFTVSVTSETALPSHCAAGTRAVTGAAVYRSDAAESAEAAATGYVGVNTYAVTDESGKATLTLYNEGYVLLNAFRTDTDEARYTVGASVLVHVTAAGDLDAVKQQLREELDAVYNDEQHPESVFTAENWQKVQDAYNTAVAAIDAAKTSGAAGDAQQKAIQTIKGLQSSADSNNKANLVQFRRLLAQLPDDVTKLDATATDTVAQLKTSYEAMTAYQRGQLTGREQKKYDAIANAELAPAVSRKLTFQQDYSSVPAADQAALDSMIAYLQANTRADDKYTPEIGGNMQAQLFSFNTTRDANYGTAYDRITEAASLTQNIVACVNPDYAAYLLCRDAAISAGKKDGPGVITGTGWSISDASMTMYVPAENSSNTTRVLGHMTYTVNGTQYAVKSVTVSGLETGTINRNATFYDTSSYRGRFPTQCNQVIPDTFLQMTTGFDDVTVTVTWAPVGGDAQAAKEAAITRLNTVKNGLTGDGVQAAYDAGVQAIQAAATAAEVDKAYQAAVVAMRKAADYGKVQVIVENTTFTSDLWPDGKEYWDGELVNEWIDLNADSTMMNCIVAALDKHGFTQTGAENGYISSIEGLSQMDGGDQSGWMGTLNDWFTNFGFSEFTVENGSLSNGDVIRIMYTREGLGADLDGTFGNSDTTLTALDIEGGRLLTKFAPGEAGNTYEYTLAIDGESADLKLTPTAANKNYLTKIFLNEKVTSDEEGGSFFKRTQKIPVAAGDTIYVGCGEVAWPSMNKQGEEAREYQGTWYVLHVVNASAGASYVEDLIDALPDASDVSYDNYQQYGDAADVARKAYEDLDKAEQGNVDTAELAKVEAAIAQFKAIDDVKAKIDALPDAGKVTLAERDAVKAAQDAYDALTAEQKDYLTFAQAAKVTALAKRIAELEAAPIKSVEELIDAIGEVTLDSKSAIDTARAAYDGLTKAQQAKVSNYAALTAAETAYAKLAADKADQDAADAVIAKINAIGTVTLDSKKAIDAARKAYDKLTAAQQTRVSNYATLTTAETTYAKLVADKADQDAADAVIAKIDAIGTVTLKSKKAIDAARKAYDKLTAAQQAKVSNYATLTAAEAAYAKLVADKADQDAADAVIAKINAIGTVTLKSKKAIDAARKAYDKLTAAQQARVSNYAALTAAETTYAKLVQDKADQDAADAVIAKINAIGVVSRAAKSRIDAARKAYDGLTDAQKVLVPASVVKTLTDAETAYSNLPPRHSSDDTADSTKPAQSSRTGDAGIAIYAAMSLLSVTGGAWVIGKKRKH